VPGKFSARQTVSKHHIVSSGIQGMNSKLIDANNTNTSATKERYLEDFRLKVADAEERLRATAKHVGVEAVAARAGIEDSLQVVKGSMVATGTAMIEHTRKAENVTDQYIRDNVWNWN